MEDKKKQFADEIAARIVNNFKEVLTSEEAARYMGVSQSYLYKLTMAREIPHYKSQTGGRIYFNRHELEEWLQENPVAVKREIKSKTVKNDELC